MSCIWCNEAENYAHLELQEGSLPVKYLKKTWESLAAQVSKSKNFIVLLEYLGYNYAQVGSFRITKSSLNVS